MKYDKLSTETQKEMLENRILALERDHFDNTVSEANAIAIGETTAAEQFKKNQDTIEKVLAEVKQRLAEFDKPSEG